MNGVYDFFSSFCVCPPRKIYLGMRTRSGNEASSYPVTVYNVNSVAIGTANDKAEYLTIWNANAANATIGTLYGFNGPFSFFLSVRPGQTPPGYVLGDYGGSVPNVLPTVEAGAEINIQNPTNTAQASAIGVDPDGSIVSYLWSKVSGPSGGNITSPGSANTNFTDLQPGNYVFKVVVTDNAGGTGEDTLIINVQAATFTFSLQPTSVAVQQGQPFTLSATVVNGTTPMVFRWKNKRTGSVTTNNTSGQTRTDSITFNSTETEGWEVEVEDANGQKILSATAIVTVTAALITVKSFWSLNNPFIDLNTAPTMENEATQNIAHNAVISVNFPQADIFTGIEFPETEPIRATWNNGSALGSGVIGTTNGGGQEYRQFKVGTKWYVVSRTEQPFEPSQPLNFVP